MYSTYQDREELEDDLYQENDGDSEGSEADSELEFRLYSQLHYSSNAGEMEETVHRGEEQEGQDSQQLGVTEKPADVDVGQEPAGENGSLSPNISKLQKNLKKTGEKHNKQKKQKSNPKGQRISSSIFEEVIVIDSSTDVISISDGDTDDDDDDDDDDEEGVCALKGKNIQRLQTSTPAQQGTQKRKKGLHVPVTVDSSSSESDSEESETKPESESSESSDSSASSDSSDSSDSDGLENWMILGRGSQDGDQSISLNLEGGSNNIVSADVEEEGEEEEEGSWLVSDKDKEARIYNKEKGARIAVQRVPNRYYTNKNVQCRNCNKHGHLSKNCPEPKKLSPCFLCGTPGHSVSQCPNKHCNNCGLPGHLYESCSERAYWHKQCHRCSMTGHFFDACPEIWRQYHITTKAGIPVKQRGRDQERTTACCYNCSRKGHFGHACQRQRMFSGMYPTTPFINHYDTVEDIKRRQHRIKLKVKELRKNGLFPGGSQTSLTPGPPKKKQKINHYKNNHHPNHVPQQSPNNHKPSPSHIFFKDDNDFQTPAHKTPKYKQQESASNVKPWKPKRPVPISKDPPTKLILDEADDFPRGRGKEKNTEMKNKKRKKMRKMKQGPSVSPHGHRDSRPDRLCWTVTGEKQGSGAKPEKAKKRRKNQSQRNADKKHAAQMYPTDENLFIIKQRKRNR